MGIMDSAFLAASLSLIVKARESDDVDGVQSSRVSFDRKCQRELAEFDHLWAGFGVPEDASNAVGDSVDMHSPSSSPSAKE